MKSRRSTSKRLSVDKEALSSEEADFNEKEKVDNRPVDEVHGLRSIFRDFFNASAKTMS